MKIGITAEQLMKLAESPGTRVAYTPFSPEKLYIGRLAFPRGKIPAHLVKYKGQAAPVAKACAGRRGYDFVRCEREQAKKLGITKLAKTI
jgi:hypothetical protein